MRQCILIFGAVLITAGPWQQVSAGDGQFLLDLVMERNQTVEAIVKSPTEGETPEERAQIKSIVSELFDFSSFSQTSLGRYWKDRTEAERAEFTDLCKRLIEKNYADPKLYKKAEKVVYDGGTVDGDMGEVKTIVFYKTEESTIDYQLKKVGEKWLIYDMVIDDLSVAKNNRSQFRKEIRKTSYEGLVKKLKDKLAKEEEQQPK
ncbi:MAG: ABC transporter substrate-binding protein [Candidatus Latescibacterota bacterium]|nr:ABC transporter substrate-binding protein [Candidatus Latescibacterota bacterium]